MLTPLNQKGKQIPCGETSADFWLHIFKMDAVMQTLKLCIINYS